MLVAISFMLNTVNLYAFYMCSRDHDKKIEDLKKMFRNSISNSVKNFL